MIIPDNNKSVKDNFREVTECLTRIFDAWQPVME